MDIYFVETTHVLRVALGSSDGTVYLPPTVTHQVEEPAVCSYVLRATHPLACDEQGAGADRRLQ